MNTQLQTPAIKKLDGTNYHEWAFDVDLVLRQKMCWRSPPAPKWSQIDPSQQFELRMGLRSTKVSAECLSWSQRREIATCKFS